MKMPLQTWLVSVLVLTAVPAWGWRLAGEPNDLHKWFPGDLPAAFAFNSVYDEPGIAGDGERDEVRAAFQVWADLADSHLSFNEAQPTSSAGIVYDGESVITFGDPFDDLAPGVLGLTTTWFSLSQSMLTRDRMFWQILESDIVFAEDHTFTTNAEAGAGCVNAVDLRGVAAHEIGHFLGFGHSSVPEASLYFVIADCDPSKAVLHPDDGEAARFSYGRLFDILRASVSDLEASWERTAAFPPPLWRASTELVWIDNDGGVVMDTSRPLMFYQATAQFPDATETTLYAVKTGIDVELTERRQ